MISDIKRNETVAIEKQLAGDSIWETITICDKKAFESGFPQSFRVQGRINSFYIDSDWENLLVFELFGSETAFRKELNSKTKVPL